MLSLASVGLTLAQPLLAMRAVRAATSHHSVVVPIALLTSGFILEAAAQAGARYALERCGEQVVLHLRLELVDRLLRMPMRLRDGLRLGDLLSRVGADTTVLRDFVAYDAAQLLTGTLVVVGAGVVMISLDPLLGSIVLLTMLVTAMSLGRILAVVRTVSEMAQRSLGSLTAELERALGAIRTVRAMGAEDLEHERIATHGRAVLEANLKAARIDALVGPAMGLAAHGASVVVLVIGAVRVSDRSMDLAQLVAFLLYVTYIGGPMANAFMQLGGLQRAMASLARVHEITDVPPTIEVAGPNERRPGPLRLRAVASPSQPAVEFRGVRFSYDQCKPLLCDVSFIVPPRVHVAIIGPSGSGKSTLFSLLARFYDPDAGEILLDGANVHTDLTHDACRRRLGLVEQDTPLLHGTLRDNITYGRPDADASSVDRAAQLADLSTVVARLPHGLDTQVGERGSSLSGGERQRVAIARALVREPHVLLLDEPTAHLDAASEIAVLDTVHRLARTCTVLTITHRLSPVHHADLVLAIEGGKVRYLAGEVSQHGGAAAPQPRA